MIKCSKRNLEGFQLWPKIVKYKTMTVFVWGYWLIASVKEEK